MTSTVYPVSNLALTFERTHAGTVEELSEILAGELVLSGFSLGQDEVKSVILAECRYYSGWSVFESQSDGVIAIDAALILDRYEWSILEPAIRAHLNLLQARRMESIRSLGAQEFGLSVSEAEQTYQQERASIPKIAFIEPPYSLELD